MSQAITSNSISEALTNFDQLPDAAQVRLPVVMALYACSASTIWRGIKSGHIPKPQNLTPRTTTWNVGKLRQAKNGNSGVQNGQKNTTPSGKSHG